MIHTQYFTIRKILNYQLSNAAGGLIDRYVLELLRTFWNPNNIRRWTEKNHLFSLAVDHAFTRPRNHLERVDKSGLCVFFTCRRNDFHWTRRWHCWDMATGCTGPAASCTLRPHYHLHTRIQRPACTGRKQTRSPVSPGGNGVRLHTHTQITSVTAGILSISIICCWYL